MTTFIDGPAAGVVLQLKRAPILLRVVQSPAGDWDALDQLDDRPCDNETVFVYRMIVATHFRAHVCRSPRSQSGWIESADYRIIADQPQREVLHDNRLWANWCEENRERLIALFKLEDAEAAK